MKPLLLLALMLCRGALIAQDGATVSISPGPPTVQFLSLMFYSGGNLQYLCQAKSVSPNTSFTITSATAASPSVFTFTGHGFEVALGEYTPRITISGATTTWAALNGDWLLSSQGANTFTLQSPVTGASFDGTGLGALSGTVVLNTTAPRLTASYWSIRRFTYDGSNNQTSTQLAFGTLGARGLFSNSCSNRTSAAIEWK